MAERVFAMIREIVADAARAGEMVSTADVVSTLLATYPDLDLSEEELTIAVAHEASAKGVAVYFSHSPT